MPLLTTGKSFIRALEASESLAVYMPLEGGFEGRYQRRLRYAGYSTFNLSARGLGDLNAYLMDFHGVRPAHLGKKNIGQEGAVGMVYYVPPVAAYQLANLPAKSKGLILWIIEGQILSNQEKQYLCDLAQSQPRLKIVLELGGDRQFSWKSLKDVLI